MKIGSSALDVPRIGLGGMRLSLHYRPSEKEAIEVLLTAVNVGVRFIDTANAYCLTMKDAGHNERLISKALALLSPRVRKQVVVATKGGINRPEGDWVRDGRPSSLRKACEKSLSDLGMESIPLYQLHAPDPKISFEDQVGTLDELKKEGKIQNVGLSNVNLSLLKTALRITKVESVQNQCSIYQVQDFQNGLYAFCESKNITYIPFSPVGGGKGHLKLGEDPFFIRLGKKYQSSPHCIALAWLLKKGKNILPIPGASSLRSAKSSFSAIQITLEQDDSERIDAMTNLSAELAEPLVRVRQ